MSISKTWNVPREEGCFACGNWMDERKMHRGKRSSVHETLRRRVLVCSLQDMLLCPRCKGVCVDCACVIPRCQVDHYEGRCEDCRKKSEEKNKGRKRLNVQTGICKKVKGGIMKNAPSRR